MTTMILLAAAALGQAQSHDIHELEKVSFTVIAEARDAPRNARYYKVSSNADSDGDGLGDDAVLKLVCTGGTLRHASLQVEPSSAAGKKKKEVVTVVKSWGPSTPQFRSAQFHYNIKNADKARLASRVGWTEVTIENGEGLCPR